MECANRKTAIRRSRIVVRSRRRLVMCDVSPPSTAGRNRHRKAGQNGQIIFILAGAAVCLSVHQHKFCPLASVEFWRYCNYFFVRDN